MNPVIHLLDCMRNLGPWLAALGKYRMAVVLQLDQLNFVM
jgi:hypothetical protein